MTQAYVTSSRSTCVRRRVGAVIVRDKRIISSGFNGVVSGHPHCTAERDRYDEDAITCVRIQNNIPSGQRLDLCRAVHAEQNAITQAATYGIPIAGADLYCTTLPCQHCFKLIIASKISKIYYSGDYDMEQIRELIELESLYGKLELINLPFNKERVAQCLYQVLKNL